MEQLFGAIPLVGPALAIVAFIVAAAVLAYQRYLAGKKAQLMAVAAKDRARLAETLAETFRLNLRDIPAPERANVVLRWIREKTLRLAMTILGLAAFGLLILALTFVLRPSTSPETVPRQSDVEKLTGALRLGTTRDSIAEKLGEPAIVTELPVSYWYPSDVPTDGTEPELRNIDVGMSAALYELPSLLTEVTFLDDVVVQYSVLMRVPMSVDLALFPDLRWMGSYADTGVGPLPLGEGYFSSYWQFECTEARGVNSTADFSIVAACRENKFTDWTQLRIGYQYGGAELPSLGMEIFDLTQADANPIQFDGAFGMDLLAEFHEPSRAQCDLALAAPYTQIEEVNEMLLALSKAPTPTIDEVRDALVCASMRTLKPNGFVVTDFDRAYPVVTLPTGEFTASPDAQTQGIISNSVWGSRRNPYLRYMTT